MTVARRFRPAHSGRFVQLGRRVGLFLLVLCFPGPGASAQIDPLVYLPAGTTARWTLNVTHTVDTALFSEDGRTWRSDEETLQLAVERPVTPDLAMNLALVGSHSSAQVEGQPRADTWALDQLSVVFIHPLASQWFGGRPTLSGGVHLPLGAPSAKVGYRLRASSAWLSDPLALELDAGLQVAPQRRPVYDLGAAITFVANRRVSLVGHVGLGDVLGPGPDSTLWLGLYRHASDPGGPLWGFGFEHAVESGRTVPGYHLLLSVGL
ncbi:hypothetical protein [Limnochorda pilosa]|uniref:Uncharacterized protein n=1 Tax=Limnochorda pilosa TaxID=1555112 RepID=A0A0K2SH83_LIMPI|nr:hypothetical protein [Limnochorda pilosa]BAS26397.1 hypothetical protein LIP_0540 [Limnochorda pilosa]